MFQISGIGNAKRAISVMIFSTAIVKRFPLAFRQESVHNLLSDSQPWKACYLTTLTLVLRIRIPVSGNSGQREPVYRFGESTLHRERSTFGYRGDYDYEERDHKSPLQNCNSSFIPRRVFGESRVKTQKGKLHTPKAMTRDESAKCIQSRYTRV